MPILADEPGLRLLSLQHNLIKRIQHLDTTFRLVFLDLYHNQSTKKSYNGQNCFISKKLNRHKISIHPDGITQRRSMTDHELLVLKCVATFIF